MTFTYTVTTHRNGAPFASMRFGSDMMAAHEYMATITEYLHNRSGFLVALVATSSDPRLSYVKHPGHSGF